MQPGAGGNGELVDTFLDGYTELSLERARELLPFLEGVDGTYVARMVKSR